ncbi:MAG TPA: ABC transporter substrate-binding protein [Deltaproteobacteria bacterium]|nr:ABC transporter substrate-binding protein [Deltaproteobacteria bacterium]
MRLKITVARWIFLLIGFSLLFGRVSAFSYSVQFTDSSGNTITLKQPPVRVVSLVPAITEILFAIGAQDALQGTTYHSSYLPGAHNKAVVGGFFSPSMDHIRKLAPDVIFYAQLQQDVKQQFSGGTCRLINLETRSIADSFRNIRLMGEIFNREKQTEAVVSAVQKELALIAQKTAKIPPDKKKRVLRLMGLDPVMTPGDDSFQNEMIRAAGGIPPQLNKDGEIVAITESEWRAFNPQIIYGCGGDRKTAETFLGRPGWQDVEAVKTGRILYFPCDLTCRAATHTGYFVSWLSSTLYGDEFSDPAEQVYPDGIVRSRTLTIDLPYVKHTRVATSRIYDFLNKTLVIDFVTPLSVVSTLEGFRPGIETVGNHYAPPTCWGIWHHLGLEKVRKRVFQVTGVSENTASFLFTGADMDHLSVKRKQYKAMTVYALVTAGVKSNAVRMSKDKGGYYELGTINAILLTNMKLSNRAMSRAVISATEAKTAALMDMDIRSSYSPQYHRATGTGTDNIIVVQGTGISVDNTGGHTKLGELIAAAVYEGVQEAVYKQNGLEFRRNIFKRLEERNISVYGLVSEGFCECGISRNALAAAVEEILLDPRYSSFVATALVLSDDHQKGLVTDLGLFKGWCKNVAEEIAGKEISDLKDRIGINTLPPVMKLALNGIINGVFHRMK